MDTQTTTIRCRCCGGKLDLINQPSWRDGGSISLVTCWNKQGKCRLYGQTLELAVYEELDISIYQFQDER